MCALKTLRAKPTEALFLLSLMQAIQRIKTRLNLVTVFPSWQLGTGLRNLFKKKNVVTETATEKFFTYVCKRLPKFFLETLKTESGENRKKAVGTKRNVLSTKVETSIGF